MRPSKAWRNEFFRAIEAAGLSPDEFDGLHDEDEIRLVHRPSGAYFIFGGVPGD